jgi:hypothetical protein
LLPIIACDMRKVDATALGTRIHIFPQVGERVMNWRWVKYLYRRKRPSIRLKYS